MALFDVDFQIIGEKLIPTRLREPRATAWVRSLLAPIVELKTAFFDVFFVDVSARAKRSGQKLILEEVLRFEFQNLSIYIDNSGDDNEINFFYNSFEGRAATFFSLVSSGLARYFFNRYEFDDLREFKIFVPSVVLTNFTEEQIRAEVDKYRPAGTKFQIIIV